MNAQLDLLASYEPYSEPDTRVGKQHRLALVALYHEHDRGLSGEELTVRCPGQFKASHVATSRLNELMAWEPVPLVCRSEKRERPTVAGVKAFVYFLTDEGRRVAARLTEGAQ